MNEIYLRHLRGGEPVHYPRYCRAAEWIAPLLLPGVRVLDCGDGDNPFRGVVRALWPQVELTDTGAADLRYPLPLPSGSYDLVLAMEVIEHLKDRTEDERATFSGSGVRNLLAEAYRVLKPGGRIFVSTPNLACWHSIHLLLSGRHPYFFQPHNRELTWHEVNAFLAEAGFAVERAEIFDVWHGHGIGEDLVDELKSRLGPWANPAGRGDCIFAIGGKH